MHILPYPQDSLGRLVIDNMIHPKDFFPFPFLNPVKVRLILPESGDSLPGSLRIGAAGQQATLFGVQAVFPVVDILFRAVSVA